MKEKLTLEERIARAEHTQAASPESAAKLVQQLARLHNVHLFHGNADLDLMYELIGPYMEQVEEDILHYSGLCVSIHLAFTGCMAWKDASRPSSAVLEARAGNAVVLLGLMLMDHVKGRGRDKEVYHCTRMTLKQYLDAVERLAAPGEERPLQKFRRWRELFQLQYDPASPLPDVLAELLRQYIRGWKVFHWLDHILRCAEEFLEEREQDPDAAARHMERLRSYSLDLPDPAGEGLSARALRSQLFLPERDLSPASLRAMAGAVSEPEFQALLERCGSERQLLSAKSEVTEALANLFMLWALPYLWMGEG